MAGEISHSQIYAIDSRGSVPSNIYGSEGERRISARVVESCGLARMG
jgi:hypothetical protein